MSVIRLIAPALVCAAIARPVSADVTLQIEGSGRVFGGETPDSTEYRKGLKVRTDSISSDGTVSTILDLGTGRVIMLWHHSKTAVVTEPEQMAASLARSGFPQTTQSIAPTAESRQIAGWTCVVHRVRTTSGPMTVEVVPPTRIVMEGSICLVRNGPGQAEFTAFYRAMAERGFAGNPGVAKVQPAAAKAMAETYRQMAELGVPFATEMTISFEGAEPMGEAMTEMTKQKMKENGNTYTTEVTSVSTAPIPDSIFEIPAGYTVTKR